MKIKLSDLSVPAKLTVAGLIVSALAIWTQWLSGDPAYLTFPPGPVFFIAVAAIVAFGARWWWTPLIGSLIALLVTAGWFALLPKEMLRLTRPGSLGHFTAGIFLGTLAQIVSLVVVDVAGLVATVLNYRNRKETSEGLKMLLRFFGAIFVLMGVVVMVSGLHADAYHNLMHLLWGAMALGASFLTVRVQKLFCIGSGIFYLALGLLGLTIGDPTMGRAWQAGPMLLHTGDHIVHLVLGSIFLGFGLMPGRARAYQERASESGS